MAIVKENGLRYAKLIHVSVENGLTQQSNKVYIMEEQPDGKIKCSYGRVGRDLKHTFKQSHEWDKVLSEKTSARKGYEDVTDLISEQVTTTGGTTKSVPIKEAKVRSLFEDLMAYANKTIKQNYKVTQDSVTQAQVDRAQEILTEAASKVKVGANIDEINDLLIKLYTTIPRQMKDVRDYLIEKADTKNDVQKIQDFLANEQDTLDTMAGQVKLISQQKTVTKDDDTDGDGEIDLLEQMGLEVTVETDQKAIDLIMNTLIESDDMRQRVGTIYKVNNKKTKAAFDARGYGKARFKDRKLFWHGSRNQNWFNIVQTGLMIRPSGVVHTGSMFGDGIYFANKSRKSLGYSSVRGSYWASGSSDKGFLALYDVYHGKQKHITHHDSSCYSLSKAVLDREGYDSVYAHGGADLRNDEFIIYDGVQCTIAYLIEFR